ncbi:hypothetical protein FSC37_07430 [Piscinibacter aquaticus]|uniref:Metal-dependent hydrolase n=1 Tax=Piscinibacter aquaticus TaxID=392597 RepID=A0A5C6U289_9BURK|nr:hypothetical protein FSC37_07430 [Piscinibacter aquaticus]
MVAASIGLAVLPDLAHLVPLLADGGGWHTLAGYITATPGHEPALPPLVAMLSHHLHCIGHSAVIAGWSRVRLWRWRRQWLIPLAGWWSHIVIDVFTHSADFYPVPVLYPFTQRGFDGPAWNTPGFQLANYAALVLTAIALWCTRRRGR